MQFFQNHLMPLSVIVLYVHKWWRMNFWGGGGVSKSLHDLYNYSD